MPESIEQRAGRLRRESQRAPSSVRGERAGESFASSEDIEKGEARDKWLDSHGWRGIGARGRPADWESQFEKHWKKLQATRAGQAKALAPTPSPSPSPTPE